MKIKRREKKNWKEDLAQAKEKQNKYVWESMYVALYSIE